MDKDPNIKILLLIFIYHFIDNDIIIKYKKLIVLLLEVYFGTVAQ